MSARPASILFTLVSLLLLTSGPLYAGAPGPGSSNSRTASSHFADRHSRDTSSTSSTDSLIFGGGRNKTPDRFAALRQKFALDREKLHHVEMGTMHSPKSLGLTLELPDDDYDASDLFTLLADMHGLWDGTRPMPGIKLSYIRNVTLKEFRLDDCIEASIFTGPGIIAGVVRDSDKPFGFMAGLTGDVGVRLFFPSRIVIYFEFGMDIALFLSRHPYSSGIDMSYYRSGLKNFFYPQLRIAYSLR